MSLRVRLLGISAFVWALGLTIIVILVAHDGQWTETHGIAFVDGSGQRRLYLAWNDAAGALQLTSSPVAGGSGIRVRADDDPVVEFANSTESLLLTMGTNSADPSAYVRASAGGGQIGAVSKVELLAQPLLPTVELDSGTGYASTLNSGGLACWGQKAGEGSIYMGLFRATSQEPCLEFSDRYQTVLRRIVGRPDTRIPGQ